MPSDRAADPPDGRADRFADADRHEEPRQDDVGADADRDAVERLDENGQREHREHAAADRAEQPADLRQGPRAEPEDEASDDQDDRDEVERVLPPDRRTGAQ